MPCRSDYLQPTHQESELQRVAQLLLYVCKKLGLPTYPEWETQANSLYANKDCAPVLCKILGEMKAKDRDQLIYNARDKDARRLADWWEIHQEKDKSLQRREAEEAKNKKLRERAISKLTSAERDALGIK